MNLGLKKQIKSSKNFFYCFSQNHLEQMKQLKFLKELCSGLEIKINLLQLPANPDEAKKYECFGKKFTDEYYIF